MTLALRALLGVLAAAVLITAWTGRITSLGGGPSGLALATDQWFRWQYTCDASACVRIYPERR
jgi:hypothetical protein